MAGSLAAASLNPPAADPAGANPSRYPFWVLLDSRAYFADRNNATTVKATTSTGHEFKVTFCLADPPAVSYFCVHFPGISVQECCTTEPRVVSSVNDLALLCFAFRTGPPSKEDDSHHHEYFVYKAASGGKHTIRPVPPSPPAYRHSWHAAIVPREGDNFLVADLSPNGDLGHYNLHIFSSETNEWNTKHVQLMVPADVLPRDLPCQTDKVIYIGVSSVGWVDLWRGIVVCDVCQEDPVLCFLPLPKADFDLHRESPARQVRDVIGFPDGFINFVEIEHCIRWFTVVRKRTLKTTNIFDVADTISDVELLSHDGMDFTEDKPFHAPAGWKIRSMLRSIYWDLWHKSHTVHVDHISPHPPEPSQLMHHLWNDRDRKWTLRNLKTAGFPTFSFYGGNVVYLVSKVESQDEDTLLVGVDIGKRKVEVIEQYCCGRSISFDPIPLGAVQIIGNREVIEPYCGGTSTAFNPISCAFSGYLNTTPSPRPRDEEVAAESAHSGALKDHLSSGNIVPKEQTQQNTWNGDDYDKYQQPTPLQPSSLTQTGQPLSSSTSTQLDDFRRAPIQPSSLTQTGQPVSSSTSTQFDDFRRAPIQPSSLTQTGQPVSSSTSTQLDPDDFRRAPIQPSSLTQTGQLVSSSTSTQLDDFRRMPYLCLHCHGHLPLPDPYQSRRLHRE